MRLFTAINFNADIKEFLYKVMLRTKAQGVRGSFSSKENLHLTLVFIGESENTEEIKSAMDAVESPMTDLQLQGLGTFKRPGGDILWFGIKKNKKLLEIREELADSLRKKGFDIEKRSYNPHLTLGRKIIIPEGFDINSTGNPLNGEKITAKTEHISLMKSERIGGKLVYTEIYKKN